MPRESQHSTLPRSSMFSQLRHAVETFAPQPRRSIDETSPGEHSDSHARSPSTDSTRPTSPLTSAQLAESALSSLRKSFVPQRPDSPGHTPRRASRDAHLSLEDRLRASFTIGEASTGTTPDASSRTSPAPAPTDDHPLSPSAIPLPQSPPPPESTPDAVHPLASSLPPIPESVPVIEEPAVASPAVETLEVQVEPVPQEPEPIPEADSVDLPPRSATPSVNVDVESLQERLRLVEQRFSGSYNLYFPYRRAQTMR